MKRAPRIRSYPLGGRSSARLWLVSAMVFVGTPVAVAVEFVLVNDVPTELGATLYRSFDLIHIDNFEYRLEVAPVPSTEIGSLCRRDTGAWNFTPREPVELDGTEYNGSQIIAYDGNTYSLVFDAGAAGLPSDVQIDALFFDGTDVVFSVDEIVELGGTQFSPADLIRHDGATFTSYWNAAGAGAPPDADVVAADLDDQGTLVLIFGDPLEIDSAPFKSSELVAWTGERFELYFADPAWPLGSQPGALAILDGSGSGDGDGDRFVGSVDCDDENPAVWFAAGEATMLSFDEDKSTMSFRSPDETGGENPLVHGVLRSVDPADFATAPSCLVAANMGTVVIDGEIPAAGVAWFYLAQASNACGGGSLGLNSAGVTRDGQGCP